MKRLLDVIVSFIGLFLFFPVLIPTLILIWLQDYHLPLYIAKRVGKSGHSFPMVKLRSMVVNADKTGVDSTGANDLRITSIGRFVRKIKIDEFGQLWNVMIGQMSLVGPRPNVKRETDLYTDIEKKLLSVRPGITDISSIVFADEGEVLKHSMNPDIDYNQLIRPWKSRLGLIYVENWRLWLDIKLLFLTVINIISRERALMGIQTILYRLNVSNKIRLVAMRKTELKPAPPPGSSQIVMHRNK